MKRNTYDIKIKKDQTMLSRERQKGFLLKGPNFRCITSDSKVAALFLQLAYGFIKMYSNEVFH